MPVTKAFLAWMFLLVLPGFACNSLCTDGSGTVTEEGREISSLTGIKITIPVEVVIYKGMAPELKIVAHENILKLITTKVSGGKLLIESDHCFNSDIPVRLEIRISGLSSIELTGSGSVVMADTFQVEKFTLEISGSGRAEARLIASEIFSEISGSGAATLIGSANKQHAEIAGSGKIDATALPCNHAEVEISGSGSMYIYAIDKITAYIAGSGIVYYKGNANIKSEVSGSGKVISNN